MPDSGRIVGHHRERPLVLLVVDDALERDACSREFASFGCRLLVASTAEEARRVALFAQPDFVVIDMATPRLDDLGLVPRLRIDDRMHATRIIALTTTNADVQNAARMAGCDAILVGPIAGNEDRGAVGALLLAMGELELDDDDDTLVS